MVEFTDYQCMFCAQYFRLTYPYLLTRYEGKLRYVSRHFPIKRVHPKALKAAEAAECAYDQGKFWEYHDRLFANQQALQPESLKVYAAAAGLDATTFNECLDSAKYADRVQAQMDVGTSLGVTSTPTVFVNGRPLAGGAVPFEMLAEMIEDELQRHGRD